jgi:hypothetical protein
MTNKLRDEAAQAAREMLFKLGWNLYGGQDMEIATTALLAFKGEDVWKQRYVESQNELAELEGKLKEWEDDQASCMNERCGDEVHCTCVPSLRRKVKMLQSTISELKAGIEKLKPLYFKHLETTMTTCFYKIWLPADVSDYEHMWKQLLSTFPVKEKWNEMNKHDGISCDVLNCPICVGHKPRQEEERK